MLEESAVLREKDNFHSLVNHLIEALDTIEGKEMMKKSAEGVQNRENIIYLRYQLTLMLVKHGSGLELYEPELKFYLKYQYLHEVTNTKLTLRSVKFTKVSLIE